MYLPCCVSRLGEQVINKRNAVDVKGFHSDYVWDTDSGCRLEYFAPKELGA